MIGSPQNLHAAARTLITDELTAIGQEARQSYKNSGANAALNKSEMLTMVPPIFVQEPLEIDGMDHVRADSPAGDQLRNMQLLVGSPSPADPDPYIHVVSDSTRLHDNLYELSAAASNIRHRSLCEKSAQGAQTVADSLEDAVNVFGSNEFKRAAHKRNHTWSGPSATQNMGWPKRQKGIQDMPLAWIEEHPEHYYEVVQAEPWYVLLKGNTLNAAELLHRASQDFFTPPELLQFVHVDSETFLENIPESIPTV